MGAATPGVGPITRSGWRTWLGGGLGPPLATLLGSTILLVAAVVPVWISQLRAPQYPKGLWLWVYGGRVDGDLREINGLNHYIGMRTIDPANVPELILWAPMIIGLSLALSLAVFQRGWFGRLALIGLWLAPVGILADIQRWLAIFGQNLDPQAALRLDPFIPWVIGPTEVWNFDIVAFPGPALILLLLVALLATLARRLPLPSRTVQLASTVAALGVVTLLVVLVAVPALRPADGAAAGNKGPAVASSFDLAAAVASADPGATVRVPEGTYRVNLEIDRPLTLVAVGEVVLDGGGRGTVITITAPDVTVRGFRVQGSGGQVEEGAGVKVLADRATVEGNRFEQVYVAVSVQGASDADIIGNVIVGLGQVTAGAEHANAAVPIPSAAATLDPSDPHAGHGSGSGPGAQGDGISLWNAGRVLIRDNDVREVRDAIYLAYATDVLIDTNRLLHSRYAVHTMFGRDITLFGNTATDNLSGMVMMNTDAVTVGRNVITDSRSSGTGYGILLKDVRGPHLRENVFARNRIGLQAEGTWPQPGAEAVVYANRFTANRVGVALMATADLAFGANSFDGNLTQVLALEGGVRRQNVWAYQGAGNAWSDYAGYDVNGDGIGDVAHVSGGAEAVLLTQSPALELLTTSPAFHLMAASQVWWSANFEPTVIDLRPMTTDVAPPVAPAHPADAQAAWLAFGGLLVLPSVAAARRMRGSTTRAR